MRGSCDDADRGEQLEHHQDLPGVQGTNQSQRKRKEKEENELEVVNLLCDSAHQLQQSWPRRSLFEGWNSHFTCNTENWWPGSIRTDPPGPERPNIHPFLHSSERWQDTFAEKYDKWLKCAMCISRYIDHICMSFSMACKRLFKGSVPLVLQ